LNQREAAKTAGISQGHWSKIENGRHDPSLAQVLRIQRLFGLDSVESFFGPSPTGRIGRGLDPSGGSDETPAEPSQKPL
jgi:DNA-binding XRE family transcriptional regulator